MNDRKMIKWLALLLALPLLLACIGGDTFRYPCQDPKNWDKEMCKLPTCDVTRTCPEHIFKGQRDPRLGPPKDGEIAAAKPLVSPPVDNKGCK
jgi:hypothetical protein